MKWSHKNCPIRWQSLNIVVGQTGVMHLTKPKLWGIIILMWAFFLWCPRHLMKLPKSSKSTRICE